MTSSSFLLVSLYPCFYPPLPSLEKNASKFKEWLGIGSIVDLKPNQEVTEVIGYLAYETVREASNHLSL